MFCMSSVTDNDQAVLAPTMKLELHDRHGKFLRQTVRSGPLNSECVSDQTPQGVKQPVDHLGRVRGEDGQPQGPLGARPE